MIDYLEKAKSMTRNDFSRTTKLNIFLKNEFLLLESRFVIKKIPSHHDVFDLVLCEYVFRRAVVFSSTTGAGGAAATTIVSRGAPEIN